jgi:hypothetical protein
MPRLRSWKRTPDLCQALSDWLHVRRIIAHASMAALGMWLTVIVNMAGSRPLDRFGQLKGMDFLQFYAAASLLKGGQRSALYDIPQFLDACERAVPHVKNTLYLPVYPPQISLLFLPFSYLSYLQALAAWSAVSIAVYAFCLYLMARELREIGSRFALIMTAFAFPPLMYTIEMGQISILILLCISVATVEYINGRETAAGLALGCTLFKPPMFATLASLLLVLRTRNLLLGLAISALAQAVLTEFVLGLSTIRAYAQLLSILPHSSITVLAVKPFLMQSLRGFWLVAGAGPFTPALWVISGAPILVALARFWRSEYDRAIQFAALIIAAVLVDPHLYVYDAIVLGPAIAVIVDRCRASDRATALLKLEIYALVVTLALGAVTRYLHVQVSVLLLCAVFYTITLQPLRHSWIL